MEFLDELRVTVGPDVLSTDRAHIQTFLKDNSWLSPILTGFFRGEVGGSVDLPDVSVVVSPNTLEQLRQAIGVAVRHGVPITPRGRGTSNFGQSIPLQGGMLLDLTQLNRILEVTDSTVTAEAGALQGDVDAAARRRGRELTVLTTTYAAATAGGWVAGGHVGLGAGTYGTIWDGNVLAVKLLTAEDPPRTLSLQGADLYPALHTYGTVGVITEVTFPVVPIRVWRQAVAAFETFEAAAYFTMAVAEQRSVVQSVVAADEAPMPFGFTPLRRYFTTEQSGVLMIVDGAGLAICERLAVEHGGTFHAWSGGADDDEHSVSLAYMVYGHRMLWNKRQAPDAAFLHVYFSPGREFEQLSDLKRRFGRRVWRELKYMHSAYLRRLRGLQGDGLLPAAVLVLVPGEHAFVKEVMAYCDGVGISYLNPHTFVLEESGLFTDFERVVALKRVTDPRGLLNPGKIGERFFPTAREVIR
jgi:FAD/FMN-containing dehydrogenase